MTALADVFTVSPSSKPVWMISSLGMSIPCVAPPEDSPCIVFPGLLQVSVRCARHLHSTNTFGTMDPYVQVKIGSQKKTSAAHKKGGKDPEWNETLSFDVDGTEPVIKLKVFNKNRLGRDDLIGSAVLSLPRVIWLHCNSLNVSSNARQTDTAVQTILDVLHFATTIPEEKKRQIQAILDPDQKAQQAASMTWCELGRDHNRQFPAGSLLVGFAHFRTDTPDYAAFQRGLERGAQLKRGPRPPIVASPPKQRSKSVQTPIPQPDGKVGESKVFGGSLADGIARSRSCVPVVCYCCVRYLMNSALDTEGLLRVPGNAQQIQELRETFESGSAVEFRDGHDVSGLLKLYLRMLDPPLIPSRAVSAYFTAVEDGGVAQKCARLVKLIENLGQPEQNLLNYICHFLHMVASRSELNKMTSANCAIVMAPNLLRRDGQQDVQGAAKEMQQASAVVTLLIDRYNTIWPGGPPRPFELVHPTIERPVVMHVRKSQSFTIFSRNRVASDSQVASKRGKMDR